MFEQIISYNENRRSYFKNHQSYISETNLSVLKQSMVFLLILVLFFIMITPTIFPTWKMTIYYLVLFPTVICYGVLAIFLRKCHNVQLKFVQPICLSFYFVFMLELIGIDVWANPKTSAPFFR